ncbi:hypothetical protein AWH56_010220 [Anaerobacillus isosaccharinicus]|uniref:Uncharacterized protein n=1 Tax=Anaerobacillus isosaccharinicus TaxID=1532552 RepID=A0A7S7LBK8_9BACI|nr:hypothetical protein [Anaerobacillus isosaccharinicus]MBA5588695.1 hypothetical protein [Anaerobacillus isosaccharinicus]QOY37902.1 hypothetical protein AWH56_010220 [Anaerobacillus isosaccharinicus]
MIRVHTALNESQEQENQVRIKVKHVQTDEEAAYANLEEAFSYIKGVIGE